MRFKNTPWLSALLLAAGLSALPVLLFSLPVPVYIPLLAASASSLSAALTALPSSFLPPIVEFFQLYAGIFRNMP